MTQPGSLIAPQPGWWVRSENVGVNLDGEYGWVATASGGFLPVGHGSGTYGWSSDASGSTTHPTVSFDAVGAGSGANIYTGVLSWTHTATAGAYVIVDIVNASGAPVVSVVYGSATMSLIGTTGSGALSRYGLAQVPGGAQTVTVSFSGGSFIGQATSISYLNVGAVGTSAAATGTTSMSQSATCATGQFIVQSLGIPALNATTVVSGGTDRYAASSGAGSLEITDSTASTTFTGSAGGGNTWYSLVNVLVPITKTASAVRSITPTLSGSLHKTIHIAAAKTITPAFSTGVSEVTHAAASLNRNPSITAAANFDPRPGAVSKNVTPAISTGASVHSQRSAALNIAPSRTAAAGLTYHIGGSLNITPTISSALVSAKLDYTDNFNRSNSTTTLGSNWVAGFGTLGINSNAAYPVTVNTSNYEAARWVNPLNTDDQQVTLTVTAAVGTDNPIVAILGSDSSGTCAVGSWFTTNAYIYTFTGLLGSTQAGTQRATASGQTTPVAGDTLSIKRVGNVYTLYHNGTQTLTWTDSSNVLTRGSSNRLVGFGIYQSATGNYRKIDAWEAKDV